ncbi:TPA: hypothetical protein HA234_03925, partial [Candidatus Woesearchaeota archaeon]|nr:hypothetical protein [Candidatus Woesearchaeota archaeon]
MTTFKNIFTNWRVLLLLTAVLLSLISIHPRLFEGDTVTIRSVVPNSSALQAGIQNPSPRLTPLSREAIISLNGNRITSVDNYYSYLSTLKTNRTINVETNKGVYSVSARGNALGQVDLGLRVYDTPRSNLRKGLDLEGGTRVLLRPAEPVGKDTLDITIDNLKERLNVYGLSDVSVRAASDLSGENFILIEIAGVTEEEVKDLLARQGKFEAKVGNETVFFGGKKDITYVCRTADCSGIDPSRGCAQTQSGYGCSFFFTITLSSEAAERQAAITDKLSVVSEDGSAYLSENLLLYLDDKEVDSLRIGAELKGRATTSIQISGGGSGRTQQEAVTTTLQNMKRLQTIIITGSLPVKLEVEKMDTISPSLGKEFLNNIILVGALAVVAVVGVVLFRYRKARIIIPMVLTLLS